MKNYKRQQKCLIQLFEIVSEKNNLLRSAKNSYIFEENFIVELKQSIENTQNNDFSFLEGKASIIVMYILLSQKEEGSSEDYSFLENYLIKNKNFLLSENYENSFLYGKTGIIFMLGLFYSFRKNAEIKSIISELVSLVFSEAKLYKNGINWLPDQYNHVKESILVDKDVFFIISFLSNIFYNDIFDIFKLSINSTKSNNKIIDLLKKIVENQKYSSRKEKLSIPNVVFNVFKNNFPRFVDFVSSKNIKKAIKSYIKNNNRLNQYQLLKTLHYFVNFKYTESEAFFNELIKYHILRSKIKDKTQVFKKNTDESVFYSNFKKLDALSTEKLFETELVYNNDNDFIISQYAWTKLTSIRLFQRNSCFYHRMFNQGDEQCITFIRVRRFSNILLEELIDIADNQILLFYAFYQGRNTINNFKKVQFEGKKIQDREIREFLLKLVRTGILIPDKDA